MIRSNNTQTNDQTTEQQMNDSMNQITLIGAQLAEFDAVEAGISALERRYSGVAFAVSTTKGMAEAIAARAACRAPRVKAEKVRKDAKAPILALGRSIDSRAAEITARLVAIEDPIDDQIKAEEDRREQAREAKRRAEAERIRAHEDALAAISAPVMTAVGKSANDIEQILIEVQANQPKDFEEYQPRAERAHADVLDKLAGLLDQARRREEAERKAAAERKATEDADRRQAEEAKAAQDAADRRLRAAAPMMLDALRQWAKAEQADDDRELANARASRDAAIAAATEGGAA